MTVRDIVRITGGKLLSGDPNREIAPSVISTDSRTIKKGDLFLGLSGKNFRGEDFVAAAFKKGAIGAIATMFPPDIKNPKKIAIKVKDGVKALQSIAIYHRSGFKMPVVAVTGSNGKTTVKEMVWMALSSRYNVLKNEGTKNNHIGVPQTLLKLDGSHEACVLELGANHKGEIRDLSKIARPAVAVITNIGPSHLKFFGSLNGVYETKKEILEFLDKRGAVVVNGDDGFLLKMKPKTFRMIKFGFGRSNDFKARIVSIQNGRTKFILNDKEEFTLNVLGIHSVYNALAAIAVARLFFISYNKIRKALFNYRPERMRLGLENIRGITILNDSYNSNPMSMRSALEVMRSYPAKAKWIVAGDMMELGRKSINFHRMIGEIIAGENFDGLLTLGKLSRYTLTRARACGMSEDTLWHCSTHDEIADILKRNAGKGDVVLLKGSRGMRMEEVLNKLKG